MTRDELIAALIAGGLDDREHLEGMTLDQLQLCYDEMIRQKND